MTPTINPWPSGPRRCGATDESGGQICDAEQGDKNLWVRTGRHWKLNLATFNMRTLSSQARLAGLFEDLSGIAWDIIGFSEVISAGETYTVLTNRHILCYRGLQDKREFGVGFLVHKDIVVNIHEFTALMRG